VRQALLANRGFIAFLLVFGLFRTAIADWNPVPSGSMNPAILEGDVVLVNRLAYNVKLPLTDTLVARTGEPQRGDVVVFSSPVDGTRLIKRLVAVPGDVVAMHNKKLVINGEPARYALSHKQELARHTGPADPMELIEHVAGASRTIRWYPVVLGSDSFQAIVVPAGHYLMLGDNRDNSKDSRYIGTVPRELLIGRAERIVVSVNILDRWMPRWERFGMAMP
jgi:signal peptidase I